MAPAVAAELLQSDATPYRGLFEVRPAEEGRLTVVNVVHLEDYLRGVVPNELSPQAFPQIEALKAQAVAARTYALSHLGDYSSKGYDVCATPSCQVYRGQSSEHPLTDRAVEETRGIVATWRGRAIHAYYTSTCGGHTEEGGAIFDDDAPYLRGVACLPERSSLPRGADDLVSRGATFRAGRRPPTTSPCWRPSGSSTPPTPRPRGSRESPRTPRCAPGPAGSRRPCTAAGATAR